ncbi:MAG: CHC2 zinc finger domain-containing protein [Candidatus Ornithomonoglobus sp.]
MNIFKTVRNSIAIRQAAELYGMQIRRDGFTNCLFHNDRHPSMKLYKDHYHCFACGAHGDVTALSARLLGLSQFDAAKQLLTDFNIPYEFTHDKNPAKRREKTLPPEMTYNPTDKLISLLSDYISILEEQKLRYIPDNAGEELHPLYVESMNQLPQCQYYLDILRKGSDDERNELICNERRFFYELSARCRQSRMAV